MLQSPVWSMRVLRISIQVLKFGAYIVDALVAYNQPCFVYIPPKGKQKTFIASSEIEGSHLPPQARRQEVASPVPQVAFGSLVFKQLRTIARALL